MPLADKGGQNDNGFITLVAGETIPAFRAVRIDTNGNAVLATNKTDQVLGISQNDVAANEHLRIKLIGAPGTHRITVNSPVTMVDGGTKLWLAHAAAGKFTPTNPTGGMVWFRALADASGDNSIIEAVHNWNQPAS